MNTGLCERTMQRSKMFAHEVLVVVGTRLNALSFKSRKKAKKTEDNKIHKRIHSRCATGLNEKNSIEKLSE